MPWNPPKAKPAKAAAAPVAPTPAAPAAAPADKAKKEKPSAIDRTAPLGESDEILARRAAKFGLPGKKAPAAPVEKVVAAAKVEEKKEELTP